MARDSDGRGRDLVGMGVNKAGARVWNKTLELVSICREIKIQKMGEGFFFFFFFFRGGGGGFTPDSNVDDARVEI